AFSGESDPSAGSGFTKASAEEQSQEENGETDNGGIQYKLPEVMVSDKKEGEGKTQGYIAEDANTATKTDAPILLTPFSVEVIDRALMNDQYAIKLEDILRNVSGVIPTGYYDGYDYYKIRGFDATSLTFLDGLPVDRNFWFAEEPFGLERAEVLKGPASALYGYSSAGGLVNLISKRPVPGGFADLHVGVGSYDFFEAGADMGGTLDPGGILTGRFNALYRRKGSFVDFVHTSERIYLAPALRIDLGPNTSVTLLIQFLHDKNFIAVPLVAPGTVLPNPNGRLPITRNLGEPDFPNKNDLTRALLGYELDHSFNDIFSFRQNFRYGWYEVTFREIYNDTLEPDLRTLTRYGFKSRNDYWTVNADNIGAAKFETGPAAHYAIIGMDYYYMDSKYNASLADIAPIDIFDPVYGAEVGPFEEFFVQRYKQTQLGVYAQEQAILWNRLTLLAGGRMDFVWTRDEDVLSDFTQKADDHKFSPRVGVVWEFVPGVSVYGNFSKSFFPQPGYSSADGKALPPEIGTQWEGGLKTLYFGGRLLSTLAVYHIVKTNVAADDPNNPGFFINTGKQRSKGFEADVAVNITRGWDFTGAYAYTDAEVIKDNFIPSGTPTQNVPKNALSLWTKYVLQTGILTGLGVGVGGQYYSKQSGDLLDTFELPSYGILQAAAYYERGRFRAQINFDNLLDKRYFPASFSTEYVMPGEP
ncbi:MAG TPA: TonB-dependent siderophore receptor, partial [Thermodesulfobacteriota bacterium]|nr:TonB-dependent siderophore receptor [Thermodesulfobacteriota bacterium]